MCLDWPIPIHGVWSWSCMQHQGLHHVHLPGLQQLQPGLLPMPLFRASRAAAAFTTSSNSCRTRPSKRSLHIHTKARSVAVTETKSSMRKASSQVCTPSCPQPTVVASSAAAECKAGTVRALECASVGQGQCSKAESCSVFLLCKASYQMQLANDG